MNNLYQGHRAGGPHSERDASMVAQVRTSVKIYAQLAL